MQRIVKCGRCQRDFIQKWASAKKHWSQLNQVSYWTSGKDWKKDAVFCRSCLKSWFECDRENFDKLVDNEAKRRIFFSYRGHGAFDKPDLNK